MKISNSRLNGGLIGRLSTGYPKSVGEIYHEHLGFAVAVAGTMFLAGAVPDNHEPAHRATFQRGLAETIGLRISSLPSDLFWVQL